jgi:WD40 repeat protein
MVLCVIAPTIGAERSELSWKLEKKDIREGAGWLTSASWGGNLLAVGSQKDGIKLYDMQKSTSIKFVLPFDQDYLKQMVSLNAQGNVLAAGSNWGNIAIFDTRTQKEIILLDFKKTICGLVLNNEGTNLAIAFQKNVVIHDIKDQKEVKNFQTGAFVFSMDWNSRRNILALGLINGEVEIIDTINDQRKRLSFGFDSAALNVRLNDNATRVVAQQSGTLVVYDLQKEEEIKSLLKDWYYLLDCNGSGDYVLTANNTSALLFDLKYEDPIALFDNEAGLNMVSMSKDGKYVATGSNSTLQIFKRS